MYRGCISLFICFLCVVAGLPAQLLAEPAIATPTVQNENCIPSVSANYDGLDVKLARWSVSLKELFYNKASLAVINQKSILSGLLLIHEDYQAAEQLSDETLSQIEQAKGQNDVALIEPLNILAKIYDQHCQHKKAEQTYKRIIQIDQTVYGAISPVVVDALNDLASHYEITNDSKEDEKRQATLEKMVVILQKIAPTEEEQPLTFQQLRQSLYDLGRLLSDENKNCEAIKYLTQAVDLGPSKNKLLPSLGNYYYEYATYYLARAYYLKGQGDRAKPYFESFVRMQEGNKSKDDSAWLATALSYLGQINIDEEDYVTAEKHLIRAIAIHQKSKCPDQGWLAWTVERLDKVYKKRSLEDKKSEEVI